MFLDRMNHPEVRAYLEKHDTVLLVTGSTENHGKHLPLGTDTMIPQLISELAEEKLGDDIVVAPAIPYGATDDLAAFPGTVSIGADGLRDLLCRICDSLYDAGFRRFVVLNGHGGNSKTIEQVGHYLFKKGALLARIDWWLLAGELNSEWKGGHGGAEETAGVMAVDPSLIKTEYLYDKEGLVNDLGEELPTVSWTKVGYMGGTVTIPRPLKNVTDNGWHVYGMTTDDPPKANEKWGREMVETVASYTAGFIGAFARVKLPGAEA